MRAMTVAPGRKGTAGVETLDEPPVAQGELLVSGRLVGVCGTDREIAEGVYGEPPQGEARLVLGHEGLGEVLEAPVGSGFERGDLVVAEAFALESEEALLHQREISPLIRRSLS